MVRFIALASLLLSGCFAARALSRNLSAPAEKKVEHKLLDPRRPDARLAALWIGHATVLLQIDDKYILTDPVFTHVVGELSRRTIEAGLDPANVPPLAAILISHMHFDHLSFGSLDILEDRTPIVLVPPGVRANMPRYDFAIRELDRWQTYEANGLRITAVPVQHVGGRYGLDQAFEPRAFTGYVIEYHGLAVYFGGDTAFVPDAFRQTRRRFPQLALALLPICPDRPRDFMERTHEDPKHALDAFALLGAQFMLPIHFDTFINSDDAFGACPAELRDELRARGLNEERIAILRPGQQRLFFRKGEATERESGR
ncbi:MAG TPA: MBL fold metallo-hydrolase [Polyangiales bacterium]|jgi:L-ascorbate metabolism protein UlaG (beta-lactamase superfamily)